MNKWDKLKSDWVVVGKDHVSSRMVFFFDRIGSNGEIQVRIAVSNTFQNPEIEAWRILGSEVVQE